MSKPIIQIKIEGPKNSGKTLFAQLTAWNMRDLQGYTLKEFDDKESGDRAFDLEDDFHVVRIRTKRIEQEVHHV